MRFAVVAALFAGAVMANQGEDPSTVYTTQVQTITSCGPTVTDCPAEVATETAVPVVETDTWVNEPVETTVPTLVGTGGPVPAANSSTAWSYPTEEACGGVSVKTISTSVTTVIPTVIYETIDLGCAPTEVPATTLSVGTTSGVASPSGVPVTTDPVFTAGASSMGFSVAAVAAGLVAFLA